MVMNICHGNLILCNTTVLEFTQLFTIGIWERRASMVFPDACDICL